MAVLSGTQMALWTGYSWIDGTLSQFKVSPNWTEGGKALKLGVKLVREVKEEHLTYNLFVANDLDFQRRLSGFQLAI